jgi:hypothetical protein
MNEKAKLAIGMTNLEKGDLAAADQAVGAVAQAPARRVTRSTIWATSSLPCHRLTPRSTLTSERGGGQDLGQTGARAGPYRDDEG